MNIYVGNLSYTLSEDNLREVFEEYGTVDSVKIIKDKFSGRSKGFGFIEMPDDADAQKAVDGLEGAELEGRNLRVNQARERENFSR